MTADTLTKHHHARAIAGGIECQMQRQHTAGVGIREQSQPRASQPATCPVADAFDVQLGVIDMRDLKRAVAMRWGFEFEFPVGCLLLVCSTWPLPLQCLLQNRTAAN